MQGHKYSHICNLWGKFLPASMICTTIDAISIPVGEMYLHARMFCALAHTYSIPMSAINFYMQERFSHSLIPLLFKCLYVFYSHGCNVRAWNLFWASVAKPVLWQLMILLLCTLAHRSFIPMDAINFYMQEHFLHLLIWSHQIFPCYPKFGPMLIEPCSQIIRLC